MLNKRLIPTRLQVSRFSSFGAILLGMLVCCSGCLNPDTLNQYTGRLYPIVPGNQPFLLVRVINNSTASVDVPIVYDDGSGRKQYVITGLTPEVYETGVALDWPVTRLALCDLDNPFRATIIATLPDGSLSAVPYANRTLEAGVDFDVGDGVTFVLNNDVRSEAFIMVDIGLTEARFQPNTFTRADPFEAAHLILLLGGF
jgi:hypothetical protein